MTRTRLTLAVLAAALAAGPASAGPGVFGRKPTAARAKQLTDTLRTEPDPAKRKAALAELRDYDHRLFTEVMPALIGSLKTDPVGLVRAEAADVIGHLKPVTIAAGLALEAAAESDPEKAVRDAARASLWEYHLNGYRSTKGADGIAGQTAEPPIARPAAPRPVVPVAATTRPPTPPPAVAQKPPAATPVIPMPMPEKPASKVMVSAAPPAVLNVTAEPPLAKPATSPVSTAEPPTAPRPANLPVLPPPDPPVPVPVIPVRPVR